MQSATDAGSYTAIVKPSEGYVWTDYTFGSVSIAWPIAQGTCSFALSQSNISLEIASTQTLTAKPPIFGVSAVFSSSAPSIASVDATSGLITGIAAGGATITVNAEPAQSTCDSLKRVSPHRRFSVA